MKVSFRPWPGASEGRLVLDRKLGSKQIVRSGLPLRFKLDVRKKGRLFSINVPLEVGGEKNVMNISMPESEILMLANMCRRGRSDEAFLRAIDVAKPSDREDP